MAPYHCGSWVISFYHKIEKVFAGYFPEVRSGHVDRDCCDTPVRGVIMMYSRDAVVVYITLIRGVVDVIAGKHAVVIRTKHA